MITIFSLNINLLHLNIYFIYTASFISVQLFQLTIIKYRDLNTTDFEFLKIQIFPLFSCLIMNLKMSYSCFYSKFQFILLLNSVT